MNVDLLIKENIKLNEECQRYKEMWTATNNSLAKYRNIEKQLGLTVEEMATILKDLKNTFQIKICYNPLFTTINGTRYDLVLRQPLSVNSLSIERNRHISIDMALTDEGYELYSKWLREDKSE
ncbi:MAG: hypothetical protein IKF82_01020 [Bacilli bacterium]|nr:hypothetical protein [Bacilli bacterium]